MVRKKKTWLLSIVLALFTFSTAFSAHASSPAGEKHFLWRVRSGTATVYLLGSVHLLRKDVYPLSPVIEEAFDESNVLAVEANTDNVAQIDFQKLIEGAIYSGDDTLEKHVSGPTYELVRKRLAGSGIPLMLADRQRPWFLALALQSVELLKMGFDPALGIDNHFLSKAEGKKRILELESVDFQIRLLSGLSDDEQEAFLVSSINELDAAGEQAANIVSAWKSGDTARMEETITKSAPGGSLSSVLDKLLYRRNSGMAEKIEGYLRTGDTYFVVVGAYHLIGKKGIVELLRERGYRPEQK